MQWPGTPLQLGARFRRQPLAPSGATLRAPGVDRESAAKQRSLPCHQCRTALARARSKWKQERVVNFALDNESPIQGLSMLICRINARSLASIGGRPPEDRDFQRQ